MCHADFEAMILPHMRMGRAVALRITRNLPDAEDAVQDALLSVMTDFDSSQIENPRAWFIGAVRLHVFQQRRRWVRKESKCVSLSNDDEHGGGVRDIADTADDPEARVRRIEEEARLARLLRSMDRAKREALILQAVEGFSLADIARVTKTTYLTAAKRVSVAKQTLAAAGR